VVQALVIIRMAVEAVVELVLQVVMVHLTEQAVMVRLQIFLEVL
jgi:hypothetical protein